MNHHAYAVLFDTENLYFQLRQPMGYQMAGEALTTMTEEIAEDLRERFGGRATIKRAYADFEQLRHIQGRLSIQGVDPINVAGSGRKNAADMRLTVDAMELLYCRPEIRHYVIASGDRDYLPLIHHAYGRGHDVWIVAFADSLSNALVRLVPNDHILEAAAYVPAELRPLDRCTTANTSLNATPREGTVAAFAQRAMCAILALHEQGYEAIGLSAARKWVEEADGACPIAFTDAIQHLEAQGAVTIEQQTKSNGQACKVANINWGSDLVIQAKRVLDDAQSEAVDGSGLSGSGRGS